MSKMAEHSVFEQLKLALEDALAYERGEKTNLRTTQSSSRRSAIKERRRELTTEDTKGTK